MKVLKFGGTSLGTPERLKSIVSIVTNEPKAIVVLSAVAGTTNSLVEIASALHKDDKELAVSLIRKLHEFYIDYVNNLFTNSIKKEEGHKLIRSHIDHILSFTEDLFRPMKKKQF